ncbi:TPA: aminotransferase class I/II-fold pyridoxal phosphate-dependent enzyme, partial [Streptococcus suis]|nr:aminotransferase class I/II-fold pyridoxal phosphate-dependent enzyme [Streptococcus suis]
IPFVEKYTNLIVCSSISKSLCAPGLRIGYICANEKIVKKLEKKVIPFNVSNTNQCIAEKILENFPLSLSICSDIESSFRQLDLFMEKYTTQKSEKACGFRLYQLKAKYDGNKIIDILKERGFLIRNISASYPELGENWIRISNGTLSEIKDLMHIMKDIFEDFDDKGSDSYDKG